MKNVFNTAAIAAVLALGAVSAQAQVQSAEAGYAADIYNAKSTMSRQQVVNDYLAARKDGTLPLAGGDGYTDPLRDARGSSTLTRAEVKRDAATFAQSGNVLEGIGSVQ